ncbi:MAG: class I SAM-dependent methyltransferase [Patescibacteria group bacterium]|nr:class I SAM-dependent methyltransferase [Patescibacteria group bacterium]
MDQINKTGTGGFMNPDNIIGELGITSGMVIADFGCGAGYFTIPIAKIVKNSGKVYAVDVLSSSLEDISSKAKLYDLLNIETVRANIETIGGTKIKDKSVDFVLLANVLFQCNDYDSVFGEAKRVLKNGGKVVAIDWIPKEVPLGPKFEHCLNKDDMKKLAIKNGLKFVKEINAGDHHYGMMFGLF